MFEQAPNAEAKLIKDTIVWYEWIQSRGRLYKLAYWHDDSGYKAAAIEEANLEDLNSRSPMEVSIDLRYQESPCQTIIEARINSIFWMNNYENNKRSN